MTNYQKSRTERLGKHFRPKETQFDLSRLPEIYDMIRAVGDHRMALINAELAKLSEFEQEMAQRMSGGQLWERFFPGQVSDDPLSRWYYEWKAGR